MRPRTFILLILVLLVGMLAVILVIANLTGGGRIADILPGNDVPPPVDIVVDVDDEPVFIPPTPTPEPQFQPVVVARIRLPLGERLTEELLEVEERPVTNVALRGGYTFTDTSSVVGRITRVEIARGQEILAPMLAVDPTDIASFGSDLSVLVPTGEVAVAFPIDALTGVAYAMRPGDHVDVMMTLETQEIDPEFRSPLPNRVSRVIQSALLEGRVFLFPPISDGRLEFVPQINQVAAIFPGTSLEEILGPDGEQPPVPKRVTQLSIQQAKVLWVGVWVDPRALEEAQDRIRQEAEAREMVGDGFPTPIPTPRRFEDQPFLIILSLPVQEALALNWARQQDIKITLALRSPGDNAVFVTTSVSLPQIIDQGGLVIPDPMNFDLYRPPEENNN